MKLRRYGWYITIGVVCGVMLSFSRVNPYMGQITLHELVFQLSGSRGEFVLGLYYGAMVDFAFLMLPFFLYQFYGGIQLYRQFCVASVYVFSRTTNQVKWYLTELWGLCKGILCFRFFSREAPCWWPPCAGMWCGPGRGGFYWGSMSFSLPCGL